MFLKYINVPIFIISFAIGIFFVYVFVPDTRTILVYPTPENLNILQYRDSTGACFHLKEQVVECPTSESKISKIPMQT